MTDNGEETKASSSSSVAVRKRPKVLVYAAVPRPVSRPLSPVLYHIQAMMLRLARGWSLPAPSVAAEAAQSLSASSRDKDGEMTIGQVWELQLLTQKQQLGVTGMCVWFYHMWRNTLCPWDVPLLAKLSRFVLAERVPSPATSYELEHLPLWQPYLEAGTLLQVYTAHRHECRLQIIEEAEIAMSSSCTSEVEQRSHRQTSHSSSRHAAAANLSRLSCVLVSSPTGNRFLDRLYSKLVILEASAFPLSSSRRS